MPTPIYTQNKYNTWYHNIIATAQSQDRVKGNGTYYENHHIIPKSFDISNQKSNLVLLTAKEHYICHALLIRFTNGQNKRSMVYAFNIMHKTSDNQIRYINSKLYEINKKSISENMKGVKIHLGYNHSKESKEKISKARLGTHHSEKTKEKIKNSLSKGNYHTPNGIFKTLKEAATNLISPSTIHIWCKKHPDKIINKMMIGKSIYLQSLKESPLGKTFREIGFWFKSSEVIH